MTRSRLWKRHLEFYNTHPYVSAPVIGVTLALEEGRANGEPIDDVTIQGVKVGMMGPLAGVGDPVFWYTVRPLLRPWCLPGTGRLSAWPHPVLRALERHPSCIPLVHPGGWLQGRCRHLEGPLGGKLGKITEGASILGMFVIGALVERWVTISFKPVVSTIQQQAGAYIDWSTITGDAEGIKSALAQYASLGANGLDQMKVTTFQQNLDSLIPGLAAVALTLFVCKLLKKNVSPIVIILALFGVGIVGRLIGLL